MNSRRRRNTASTGSGAPRWGLLFSAALVVAGAVLLVFYLLPVASEEAPGGQPAASGRTSSPEQRLEAATAALTAGRYREAEQLATSLDVDHPLAERALLIAGEAASRDGRMTDAAGYYRQLVSRGGDGAPEASFYLGEVLRAGGQLQEAAAAYQQSLRGEVADSEAHARLAFLYAVTGQPWEAMPHFLAMVRYQGWKLDSLALLGDLERPIEQPQFIAQSKRQNPQGVWVRLGEAQLAVQAGDEERARRIVRELVRAAPTLLPAQAMLGQLLISADTADQLAWLGQLPDSAAQHPDIWFARGMMARAAGNLQLAAGCFAEALAVRPEHRRATYQLGQVLTVLEHPGADDLTARAELLIELSQVLDEILKSRGQSEPAMRRAAEICAATGRLWEAWAWSMTASRFHPAAEWPARKLAALGEQLKPELPRTAASFDLMANLDLEAYRVAARAASRTESIAATSDASTAAEDQTSAAQIRFAVADAGIELVYENGNDPTTPGARMFEQTGGGVGAFDYDLDGHVDLYFTQGAPWPTGSAAPRVDAEFVDHLYRNFGGRTLGKVGSVAGLQNLGFGQGVAVGDIDGDGFPDLYVANVGRNRLYRNNGDGTFSAADEALADWPTAWSTSCVLVDLNGDGLADIYDVNYLAGEQVYELICGGKACSPKVFPGAPDDVFLNRGDGRFAPLAGATPQQEAKGLGVVAARFGEDPLVGLFIANDQVPNFFLQANRLPASDGDEESPPMIELADRALLRGLAYNMDGLAMACMGVAADDLDGNGLLDLLVTNFMDEPNSLYLQDAPGLFVDATRTAGLQGPSFPYVGWGTQFFDADLDGQSDLVVVNGHVDDYRDEGKLYQMPPQFFRNRGRARFEQLTPDQLGDYFTQKYLGRGLARLDWDNDGRMDFAVSHIGQPAALVRNASERVGGFLNLVLVGTSSSRDAIGAIVEIETDRGTATRQLVAGDGYQASNQRLLQFGLGTAQQVRRIEVRWPAGSSTVLQPPAGAETINQELLIVEGGERGWTRAGVAWPASGQNGSTAADR